MQPRGPEPASALGVRDAHRPGPLVEQRRDALDVRAALGGDDGPGGEGHRVTSGATVPTLKRGLDETLC